MGPIDSKSEGIQFQGKGLFLSYNIHIFIYKYIFETLESENLSYYYLNSLFSSLDLSYKSGGSTQENSALMSAQEILGNANSNDTASVTSTGSRTGRGMKEPKASKANNYM